MNLDIQTILLVLLANVFAMAIALPLLMGWRVSKAARFFQIGAVVHAFGWLVFLAAPHLHDRLLTTLALALMSASFALLWLALDAWLGGARPGRRLMWALVVLIPVGYGLAYPNYPLRVGWANAGLAAQMLIICLALASPSPRASWRWRGLVLACMGALAIVTAWRGVLGAFFTEAYPFYRAAHPVNLTAALLNHVVLALTTLGLLAAWREEAERDITRQAQTDGLTGLPNRQTFAERAVAALAHAVRYEESLSVVMIDIDHFKRINDRHGHAAGDAALKVMAQGLRACTRAGDLTCRYGGEEFCVLITRASVDDAHRFDQRLRTWLQHHAAENRLDVIGFSSGVAAREDDGGTLEHLMSRADAALYHAKATGRGRLVEARSGAPQAELKFDAIG